jgi:hypothetical protein
LLVTGAVVGVVSRAGIGHGLAATGLFTAGGVGLAVGAGPTPSVTTLVAAVVVWDLGRYGADLGGEVGRRGKSRRTVLVHLAGSLSVGVVASVGVITTLRARGIVRLVSTTLAPVVLIGGVVALAVFAVLSR